MKKVFLRFLLVLCGGLCVAALLIDFSAVRENLQDGQFIVRVFNIGTETNTVLATCRAAELLVSAPPHLKSPKWLKAIAGQGIQISGLVGRQKRHYAVEMEAVGAGELRVIMAGPWVRKSETLKKITLRYSEFSLQGAKILPRAGVVWFNDPLRLDRSVKDGERLHFEFSVEKSWLSALAGSMRKPDFMLVFLVLFLFGWLFNLTFRVGRDDSCRVQLARTGRMDILDIGKGMACVGVVFIHFGFAGDWGKIVCAASRFAIPFFFAVSGFFLCSGSAPDPCKVVNKARHAFKLLIMGMLVGLVYRVCYDWIAHHSYERLIQDIFSVRVIVGSFLMSGVGWYAVMWYVSALLTCYMFVLLMCKDQVCYRRWVAMTPIFILGSLFCHEFYAYFRDLARVEFALMDSKIYFMWRNTFLFRGLCWFLLGCFLRIHINWLKRIRLHALWLIVLIVGGMILNVAEYRLTGLPFVAQCFLGSYVTTIAFFILAVHCSDREFPRLAWIGRNLSMYIYILHMVVGNFWGLLAHRMMWRWWNYGRAPIVLLSTIFVSYCVYLIIERIKKTSKPLANRGG